MNTLLANLNIAHIRDGFRSPFNASYASELAALHRQGVNSLLTTAVGQNGALWAQYATALGGGLEGMDGVNEPNTGGSSSWVTSTRQLQTAMWSAAHGSQSALGGVKVVNASVLGCADNATYGDQSSGTDFANLHKYWPGVNPNSAGYGSSTCGSSAKYGSLEYNVLAVQQSAHHPVYTTEAGYCTASGVSHCVPNAIAAAYVPEIALTEFLDNGSGTIMREYIYELVGESTTTLDGTLGIINPDFSPKPDYYALAGMLKRLKDRPGAARLPISYTLSGNTANLRGIPLSYADGTFGLIFFQDVSLYPNAPPVDNFSLTVNGQALQGLVASTYGTSGQWTDVPLSSTQPVALSVGNYMTILRWRNGGSPSPGPSTSASPRSSPTPVGTPGPTASPTIAPSPAPSVGSSASPRPTASPNPVGGPSIIGIDAGGHASGTWLADHDFSGGAAATYFRGTVDTSGIVNPAPQAVYETGRNGQSFSYNISRLTPGASYTARLHFAENYWTAAGQRVFNVAMSGTTQTLSNYDIVARAGAAHKAVVVDFAGVTADSEGAIAISFSASVNNALVSGIEIR